MADKTKEEQQNAEETEETTEDTSPSGTQLKNIIDGTARIGNSIGEAFKGVADIFSGRDFVVMVRINKDSLDKIDQLISSGFFKSRSESAAFLIGKGIQANDPLFSRIQDKVGQINKLQEELLEMMHGEVREEEKKDKK
jgi:hypothetical protein